MFRRIDRSDLKASSIVPSAEEGYEATAASSRTILRRGSCSNCIAGLKAVKA